MNYRLLVAGLLLGALGTSATGGTDIARTAAITEDSQEVIILNTTGTLTPTVSLTTEAVFDNFSPLPGNTSRSISGEVTRVTTAGGGSVVGLYNGLITFLGYTAVINGRTVTLTSLELKSVQASLSARGGLALSGVIVLNGVKNIDLAKAQTDIKAIVQTIVQTFANS